MKINQPAQQQNAIEARLKELEFLRNKLTGNPNRPCPECNRACPTCGSTQCRCRCSASCLDAPAKLSSESGRYPIEPAVLPLVYAMSDMQICEPCWSCEGHPQLNDKNKAALPEFKEEELTISKIPQVWFYCDSVLTLRLFDECLNFFKIQKLIHYDWHITTSFSDLDCIECAFALKPELNLEPSPSLQKLQADLSLIAEKIQETFLDKVNQHYARLTKLI